MRYSDWRSAFSHYRSSSLAVCFALVLLAYALNFAVLGFFIGPFDTDHLAGYYELAYRFWVTGQGPFPAYNPFLCGGRTLGADPQIPIYHPILALVPLLGAVWTVKLEMLAQLLVGLAALHALLRRWGVTGQGNLWGCFLFAAGGGVVARFLAGHVTLGFCFLLPAFFYLSYRLSDLPTQESGKTRLYYLALFAYCALYKPNFLIYLVPLLGLEALVRALAQRRSRPLMEIVLATGFGALANAFTYLPAGEYFAAYPRTEGAEPLFIAPYSFLANLLLPLKAIPKAWYGPGFLQRHEYNLFLGPVALWFAWCGLRKKCLGLRAERLSLIVFAVASVWVGLGDADRQFSALLPFSWLREFWPGFASARVPTRFWFGFYFAAVILSAFGFRTLAKTWQRLGFVLLGVCPLALMALVNLSKTSFQADNHQWQTTRLFPSEVRSELASDELSYHRLHQGTGVLTCIDNLQAFRSPLVEPGNALAATGTAPLSGRASWDSQSWSRIRLQFQAPAATAITLNLNHSPLWQVDGEGVRIVSKPGSPLSVVLDQPTVDATLIFVQPKVRLGIALATAAWLAFFVYLAFVLSKTRAKSVYRVGLTGGIAAGKGQVAAHFRDAGIPVINLDTVGRELVNESSEIQAHLDSLVGGSPSGTSLRELAFDHPELKASLEAYLHPRIWAKYFALEKALARDGHKLVVCEAALFVDAGTERLFDELVVVSAPTELRLRRLIERDGIAESLAKKMIRSQVSEETRRAAADHILENADSHEALRQASYTLMGHWRFKKLI